MKNTVDLVTTTKWLTVVNDPKMVSKMINAKSLPFWVAQAAAVFLICTSVPESVEQLVQRLMYRV